MWTDGNGFFYEGDCRYGDREVSEQEISDQALSAAIDQLNAQLQEDLAAYRNQFGNITIDNSANVNAKQGQLRAAWNQRKAQYNTDRAALIAQYS